MKFHPSGTLSTPLTAQLMEGRKPERLFSPGVHKTQSFVKNSLKQKSTELAVVGENFYDLHCRALFEVKIYMHNTESWFLGCGEWTLSHLQDQQQTPTKGKNRRKQ